MPRPGETPGCCGQGDAYIRRQDGWSVELMRSSTSWLVTSRFVPVAYCPWCGAWLAGLDVAAAVAVRSEPQNAAGVVDA